MSSSRVFPSEYALVHLRVNTSSNPTPIYTKPHHTNTMVTISNGFSWFTNCSGLCQYSNVKIQVITSREWLPAANGLQLHRLPAWSMVNTTNWRWGSHLGSNKSVHGCRWVCWQVTETWISNQLARRERQIHLYCCDEDWSGTGWKGDAAVLRVLYIHFRYLSINKTQAMF